jgi:hypothetical protein
MSAINTHFKSPRRTSTWRRTSVAVALIIFELAVIFFAIEAVCHYWPQNKFAVRRFAQENELPLTAEVTSESLELLQRAQEVVVRWGVQQPKSLSQADIQAVTKGLALAAQIITNVPVTNVIIRSEMRADGRRRRDRDESPTRWFTNLVPAMTKTAVLPALGDGDPRRVTSADLNNAFVLLDQAVARLQQRAKWLESQAQGSFHGSLKGLHQEANAPPLAASEQMAVRRKTEAMIAADGGYISGSKSIDLLIVLTAFGAIGAACQALASIGVYLGQHRFVSRWAVFYMIRPLTGALLAACFYFVLAAGLAPQLTRTNGISPSTNAVPAISQTTSNSAGNGAAKVANAPGLSLPDVTNIYLLSIVALFAGLFSAEAMENLRKVAEALFASKKKDDSFEDHAPFIWKSEARFESGSPLFSMESIADLDGLVDRLRPRPQPTGEQPAETAPGTTTRDKISEFVFSQLSRETQELLTHYAGGLDPKLRKALVDDLNKIIQKDLIYTHELFPDLQTRAPEIARLVNQNPTTGPELARLNKLLLLYAYPRELADVNSSWTVTLDGANFRPDSVVYVDGERLSGEETSVFKDGKTLVISLKQANHPGGKVALAVVNPADKNNSKEVLSDAVEVELKNA